MKAGFKLAGYVFVGTLLVLAIFLTSDTLIDQIVHIEGNAGSIFLSIGYLIFPIGISLAAIFLAFRCKDDRSLSRLALALLAVSFVSRLVWISLFDSYQVNDFGYYLQCGADAVRNGTPIGSRFCDGPYWKRTVFYTLPLVRAFGLSLLALKIANVLITTLTSWIFFLLCRINFGARLAAIALVFFVWQPDIWYSITLASHDIPGLFWLALFYYLCSRLQRDLSRPPAAWVKLGAISFCLGVTLFFLDFSRSYHVGAILALVVFVLTQAGRFLFSGANEEGETRASSTLAIAPASAFGGRGNTVAIVAGLFLVFPLCIYQLASAAFWKTFPARPERGETGLTCYLSVMDVLGTSNYEEINNWYERQCRLIKGREKTIFAVRKVLHEMTNDPREFLAHVERKNRVLGHADDYIEWSTYAAFEPWDTTHAQVRRLNLRHLTEQYRMVSFAEILLLMLVLWRLLLYPALPIRTGEIIPFAFSSAYFLMFLLLVESQPRYDIFLMFPFSWIAAQAVEDIRRRFAAKPEPARNAARFLRARLYFAGVASIAIGIGAYWTASRLIADGPLTLRNQAGFAQVPQAQVVDAARQFHQVQPRFIRNNHKQVMLAYPAGVTLQADSIIAVQREFEVRERESHHLRFFISNYSVKDEPFDKQITWEDSDLDYLIAVNGKIIAQGKVNDIPDNLYFSLHPGDGIVFAPKMTLQLVVRNCEKIGPVGSDRGPIMSLEYVDLQ